MGSSIGLGIDLVEIPRFADALDRWPALIDRVFTPGEIELCMGSPNARERLAARFAAKEAAFKALGSGWPSVSYHEVELISTGKAPSLRLRGRAAQLAGGREAAVSITHTATLAMAEVILGGGA